jgi:glycosyltransferase involved in cell wall biosynthesis
MIKDGYNGFLYEAGNIKQLTQAMKLVTEGHESFKHMGERARYGVEKNNGREKFYKDLFAIYSNIIKK